MNTFENWFCATGFWRHTTHSWLIPWIVSDADLGGHLLELGAGSGAATEELARRSARVTSVDRIHTSGLRSRTTPPNINVLQADATQLPFADKRFSSAMAILMLHHIPTEQAQDHAFSEICRVLRPGGVFLAFEIYEGWLQRLAHLRSTFVPLLPSAMAARLATAGFSGVTLQEHRVGFRLRALRAA